MHAAPQLASVSPSCLHALWSLSLSLSLSHRPPSARRYENTERRQALMQEKGIFHIGMGVSGGEEGARNGERRRARPAPACPAAPRPPPLCLPCLTSPGASMPAMCTHTPHTTRPSRLYPPLLSSPRRRPRHDARRRPRGLHPPAAHCGEGGSTDRRRPLRHVHRQGRLGCAPRPFSFFFLEQAPPGLASCAATLAPLPPPIAHTPSRPPSCSTPTPTPTPTCRQLRQDGAQRYRVRRHAADCGGVRRAARGGRADQRGAGGRVHRVEQGGRVCVGEGVGGTRRARQQRGAAERQGELGATGSGPRGVQSMPRPALSGVPPARPPTRHTPGLPALRCPSLPPPAPPPQSELESFLVEITASIFKKKDEMGEGYLIDKVQDKTGMKVGEGVCVGGGLAGGLVPGVVERGWEGGREGGDALGLSVGEWRGVPERAGERSQGATACWEGADTRHGVACGGGSTAACRAPLLAPPQPQGTGKWTIQQAAELSVAAPTMEAALDARFLSGGWRRRRGGEVAAAAAGWRRGRQQAAGSTAQASATRAAAPRHWRRRAPPGFASHPGCTCRLPPRRRLMRGAPARVLPPPRCLAQGSRRSGWRRRLCTRRSACRPPPPPPTASTSISWSLTWRPRCTRPRWGLAEENPLSLPPPQPPQPRSAGPARLACGLWPVACAVSCLAPPTQPGVAPSLPAWPAPLHSALPCLPGSSSPALPACLPLPPRPLPPRPSRRCAATRRATTSSAPRAWSRGGRPTWGRWRASGRGAASSAQVGRRGVCVGGNGARARRPPLAPCPAPSPLHRYTSHHTGPASLTPTPLQRCVLLHFSALLWAPHPAHPPTRPRTPPHPPAGFLDRIKQAYQRNPELPNLLVDPEFAKDLGDRWAGRQQKAGRPAGRMKTWSVWGVPGRRAGRLQACACMLAVLLPPPACPAAQPLRRPARRRAPSR